jgi:uncharacterized membrane protein YbaN (DUF454 family)
MGFVKALQRRSSRLFQSIQTRFDRALFRKGKLSALPIIVIIIIIMAVVVAAVPIIVVVVVVVVIEC